jgi:hypothetical protein
MLPRATYYRPFGKIGRMGMGPMLLRARQPFRKSIRLYALALFAWVYGVHHYAVTATGQEKFDDVDALLEFEREREAQERLFEARRKRIEAEGPSKGAYYGLQRPVDALPSQQRAAPAVQQVESGPDVVARWLRTGLGARTTPSQLVLGAPPVDTLGEIQDRRQALAARASVLQHS